MAIIYKFTFSNFFDEIIKVIKVKIPYITAPAERIASFAPIFKGSGVSIEFFTVSEAEHNATEIPIKRNTHIEAAIKGLPTLFGSEK